MSTDTAHEHHEETWLSKYIFSMDHKMISKQFLITAIIWAFIGGLLSLFFRMQLAWPNETFPFLETILGKWAEGGQITNENIEQENTPPEHSLEHAVLRCLDKMTGRVKTILAPIGDTVRFGTLSIIVQKCISRPPEETPEDSAFIKTAINSFASMYRDCKEDEEIPPPWMNDEYAKQFAEASELKRKMKD